MAFELELMPAAGPSDFLEAHRLVQSRLEPSAARVASSRRWVDRANGAVMYVSSSFSTRDTRLITFQLVLGADIVEFTGHEDMVMDKPFRVSRVALPESRSGSREQLVALITDAVHSFNNPGRAHGLGAEDVARSTLLLAVTWKVIATPGAPLDVQQRAVATRAQRKAQWLRIRWQLSDARYPLAMLVSCILLRSVPLFGGAVYLIAVAIGSLWLLASLNSARMRRRLADWLAGRDKTQSQLNQLGDLIMESRPRAVMPYKDVQLAIRTLDHATPEYEITFTNTGWRPVQMVVSTTVLLNLLAAGFTALSKEEQRRIIGPYNLDEVAPALGAMRVWGKQSITVRHRGVKGFRPVSGEFNLTLVNVNRDRVIDIFRVVCRTTR